ncbi:hypothetical protein [Carbonactinospora thermoautotrophica]|uniref:hypothetical protein n=1 Tax=Carbonactinospora thermoautotrophica TaxID=1469144 RepID=UPI0022710B98|nr:hypothetical protein [Carbonactinospora thermoautotrophica]
MLSTTFQLLRSSNSFYDQRRIHAGAGEMFSASREQQGYPHLITQKQKLRIGGSKPAVAPGWTAWRSLMRANVEYLSNTIKRTKSIHSRPMATLGAAPLLAQVRTGITRSGGSANPHAAGLKILKSE